MLPLLHEGGERIVRNEGWLLVEGDMQLEGELRDQGVLSPRANFSDPAGG